MIYVALLRGINIGPHKRISMARLRGSFESLGFTSVHTHIQSGNVVFASAKTPPQALAKKIEAGIAKDFGFESTVILRTREELERIVVGNPFLKRTGVDPSRLHAYFLAEAPTAAERAELQKLASPPDESLLAEKEIYLLLPDGVAKSSLFHNPLERRLLRRATMRNWRTVTALREMAVQAR